MTRSIDAGRDGSAQGLRYPADGIGTGVLTSLLKREPMKSSMRQQPLFDQADMDHRQKAASPPSPGEVRATGRTETGSIEVGKCYRTRGRCGTPRWRLSHQPRMCR